MELTVGLTGRQELTVSVADTAEALGSGDVPVLGTPRLIALAEAATVAAVQGHLEPGQTTVGTRIELDHLAATAVGRHVVAEAVLSAVEGRKLVFDVVAWEVPAVSTGQIAVGRVERAVIHRERFLAKVIA